MSARNMREFFKKSRWGMALAIFCIALVVYNLNLSYETSDDTRASEYLPVVLIKYHTFDFSRVLHEPLTRAYWLRQAPHTGQIVSAYPIVPGLLATPVYGAAALAGFDIEQHVHLLSKIAASIIAALAVVVFYLVARELFVPSTTFLVTIIFAFATHMWTIASRGLWQHGPGILCINLSLLALLKARTHTRALVWFGVAAGMAFWSRPANALFFVPFGVYILLQHRMSGVVKAALGAALPLAALATYSHVMLGSVKRLGQFQEVNFSYPFWQGLSGLLFSPSHGLFIFAPLFLFSAVALVLVWRDRSASAILKYSGISVVLLIALYSKWFMWWGGWSYGYRLLLETVPALTLLLGYAWERWVADRATLKVIFIACAYHMFVFEIIGAFFWPCNWTVTPDYRDAKSRARLWEISSNSISTCVNSASLFNPKKNLYTWYKNHARSK